MPADDRVLADGDALVLDQVDVVVAGSARAELVRRVLASLRCGWNSAAAILSSMGWSTRSTAGTPIPNDTRRVISCMIRSTPPSASRSVRVSSVQSDRRGGAVGVIGFVAARDLRPVHAGTVSRQQRRTGFAPRRITGDSQARRFPLRGPAANAPRRERVLAAQSRSHLSASSSSPSTSRRRRVPGQAQHRASRAPGADWPAALGRARRGTYAGPSAAGGWRRAPGERPRGRCPGARRGHVPTVGSRRRRSHA